MNLGDQLLLSCALMKPKLQQRNLRASGKKLGFLATGTKYIPLSLMTYAKFHKNHSFVYIHKALFTAKMNLHSIAQHAERQWHKQSLMI